MKFTKEAREYITEAVHAKYDPEVLACSDRIMALEAPFLDALYEEDRIFSQKAEAVLDEFQERAFQIAEEYGYKFSGEKLRFITDASEYNGHRFSFFKINRSNINSLGSKSIYSDEILNLRRRKAALIAERDQTINDILSGSMDSQETKKKAKKMINAVEVKESLTAKIKEMTDKIEVEDIAENSEKVQ